MTTTVPNGLAVVDLTHELHAGTPHGGKIPAPSFREVLDLDADGLRCMELSLPIHVGTHLDAPSHFIRDGATVEQIPLSTLVGPARCVKVDVPVDTEITVADLAAGCAGMEAGDALLIRTGWDERFGEPDYAHHPYLSVETAEWFVERDFRLVGLDVFTPDLPGPLRGANFPYPVHHVMLGAGILIMENLDLRQVEGMQFTLVIGALRIVGGDGSPARVLALDPRAS